MNVIDYITITCNLKKCPITDYIRLHEKCIRLQPITITIMIPHVCLQSVPITTKVVSSNPVHGEVYSIQHYVIKFVSDLQQVGGLSRYSAFLYQ